MRSQLANQRTTCLGTLTVAIFGGHKRHKSFSGEVLIPNVKHGSGNVMVGACFAVSRTGQFAVIDLTMNPTSYQMTA